MFAFSTHCMMVFCNYISKFSYAMLSKKFDCELSCLHQQYGTTSSLRFISCELSLKNETDISVRIFVGIIFVKQVKTL